MRVAVVSVNVAELVAAEFSSVAFTAVEPVGAPLGTTNVQVNAPAAVVVMVPDEEVPELQDVKEATERAP